MIGASGNFKHFQGDERRTGQVVQRVMQVKGFWDGRVWVVWDKKEGKFGL